MSPRGVCYAKKKNNQTQPQEITALCARAPPPFWVVVVAAANSLGNELPTHVDERCVNVADVRIQCLLDHACLHKRGARDLGAGLRREALVPEAHCAVPQKHAAAIQRPNRILPGLLRGNRRGIFSAALVILPRKEQLELE
jgi:hypothetical protein